MADPSQVRLGGVQQAVTILFADLRGYTALAEALPPEQLVDVLNGHLTVAAQAILAHEGTISTFVGDLVMAIYNAPLPQPDHALRAARTALALHQGMARYHAELSPELRMNFGVGIVTGEAVVGNLGARELQLYTAVGDIVNLAQRLEEIAGGGRIFISDGTRQALGPEAGVRSLGPVLVRGRIEPVVIYELLGLGRSRQTHGAKAKSTGVGVVAVVDDKRIEEIVQRVVADLRGAAGTPPAPASSPPVAGASARPQAAGASARPAGAASGQDGVYPDLDAAVAAAAVAFRRLADLPLERRTALIAAMRQAALENAPLLARAAWQETGMGRAEDKTEKNLLVAERTPGPERLQANAWTGDRGLTLVERAPYGVIGAITPSTNPTSTILCNSIGMVSGGNAVVFNAHPSAKLCSAQTVQILNQAIQRAGGPPDLITCPAEPTIDSAQKMMHHPAIRLLVVTGGPGVVREAMHSGKKAICAGPGNPPVVVDETADLEQAARDIIKGASFDNNVVCILEKEIIAVDAIADQLKAIMVHRGAVEISPWQLGRLMKVIMAEDHGPGKHGVINKAFVGKSPSVILREIGIRRRRRGAPGAGRDRRRPPPGLDRAAHAGHAPGAGIQCRPGDRPGQGGRTGHGPHRGDPLQEPGYPEPHGAGDERQHLCQERPQPGRPGFWRRGVYLVLHRQPDRRGLDQRRGLYPGAPLHPGGRFSDYIKGGRHPPLQRRMKMRFISKTGRAWPGDSADRDHPGATCGQQPGEEATTVEPGPPVTTEADRRGALSEGERVYPDRPVRQGRRRI